MTQKVFRPLLAFLFIWGFSPTANPQDIRESYTFEEIKAAAQGFLGSEFEEGLADVLQKAFRDLGAPEAYFIGTEDGGVIELGYRYGEGKLYQKGKTRDVYWRGPSIGFDNVQPGTKVFTLVFNFHDYKSFYKRFESGETNYYFYKGAAMSYRSRLGMHLAQIKIGVNVSEGLNPAWVKYDENPMVLPNVIPD